MATNAQQTNRTNPLIVNIPEFINRGREINNNSNMYNMTSAQLIEYIRNTRPNNQAQPQQQMNIEIQMSEESDIEDDYDVNERRIQELYLNLTNVGFRYIEGLRLETRNENFINHLEKFLTDVFDGMLNNRASASEIRSINQYVYSVVAESLR